MTPPFWLAALLVSFAGVTRDQLGAGPIRGDRPIQEYHLDPFRGLLGRRR